MSAIGIPFLDAHKKTIANKQRIFVKQANTGTSGFERSNTGSLPDIAHKPKFRIPSSSKFFTIGSCFARNIEFSLAKLGVECLSAACVIPDEFYETTGVGARNGALNAYTPQSMLELVKISNRQNKATVGSLQLGDEQWCDMLVSGIRVLTREELDFVRGKILSTYDELPMADVVVITPGYTEAWFDIEDDIFVNRSPGSSLRTVKKGARYSFLNSSPTDTCEALDGIILALSELVGDRLKIILTVSPVPMHATFSGSDVISANLYSKSNLVSAAVFTASKYDFVDYFPSYELVTFTERSLAWQADGVHVNPEVVQTVVERFTNLYFA